jgi:hypothetical protein
MTPPPTDARAHTCTHTVHACVLPRIPHLCTHPSAPPSHSHDACVWCHAFPIYARPPHPTTTNTNTCTQTQACATTPPPPPSRVPPPSCGVFPSSFCVRAHSPPSRPAHHPNADGQLQPSVSDALPRASRGASTWRLLLHGCCSSAAAQQQWSCNSSRHKTDSVSETRGPNFKGP